MCSNMKSFASLRLNSFLIRTVDSECKLNTSDSVVCVRWLDEKDTKRYVILSDGSV